MTPTKIPLLERLRTRVAMFQRMVDSKAGLIGSDYATQDQAWEMLDGLFNPLAHALTATAISLIAGYNWYATGSLSSIPAAVIVVLTLGLRLVFVRGFHARGPEARVSDWVRRFATSSLIAALGWGCSLSILICTTEGPTQFAVFALICAPIQGAAARAYAMARIVILHICVVLGIISITATFLGIVVAVPLAILYVWYQIGFIAELVALRTRMLKADHDRCILVGDVTRYNSDLAVMNARLSTFALTDGLTGVSNRRDFDQRLRSCLHDQAKWDSPLALLLIDVDHFKSFNDIYGHPVGDECLKLVAAAIRSIERPGDTTARYGGEEFALILPATTQSEALAVAEQVRCAVETMDRSTLPEPSRELTVSIGVGLALPGVAIEPRALIKAADRALYTAKQSGRNRVRDYTATWQTLSQIA